MEPIEREQLDTDVVIAGAGPAGLACAIRLGQLMHEHNERGDGEPMDPESIILLDKASELGMHSLSGAVMDPRALNELFPGGQNMDIPMAVPVDLDELYFLSTGRAVRLPPVVPALSNHGNMIVSLGKLVEWLGERAEELGISIFTSTAATDLLIDSGRVQGVITDDKGIDKQGNPKPGFEPGYQLNAMVTVLAEGSRGTLTKQLINRFNLDDGANPQAYALGIKELWEVPEGRIKAGKVMHTVGFPLPLDIQGGGWVYAMGDNKVSIGLVTGLHYKDPSFEPYLAMQQFKTHPHIKQLLKDGNLLRYGAKTLTKGGYWSLPRPYVNGALLVGESAGFMDSRRLKGIHLALKTGMLAGESIYQALRNNDTTESGLSGYQQRLNDSWVHDDMWRARNNQQAYEHGMLAAAGHIVAQGLSGGRGFRARYMNRRPHEYLQRQAEKPVEHRPGNAGVKADDKLVFDIRTSVYHSGTGHDEDQPVHLRLSDPDICHTRCTEEYGNPCVHFCPAAVYEMVDNNGDQRLKINAANCVHCKTCDIMDPYQIITWVCPQGGDGPKYGGM